MLDVRYKVEDDPAPGFLYRVPDGDFGRAGECYMLVRVPLGKRKQKSWMFVQSRVSRYSGMMAIHDPYNAPCRSLQVVKRWIKDPVNPLLAVLDPNTTPPPRIKFPICEPRNRTGSPWLTAHIAYSYMAYFCRAPGCRRPTI